MRRITLHDKSLCFWQTYGRDAAFLQTLLEPIPPTAILDPTLSHACRVFVGEGKGWRVLTGRTTVKTPGLDNVVFVILDVTDKRLGRISPTLRHQQLILDLHYRCIGQPGR
jgi:hypothetical protein